MLSNLYDLIDSEDSGSEQRKTDEDQPKRVRKIKTAATQRQITLFARDNYVQVPNHERGMYKMIIRTFMGKERKRDLTNSDLVMLNQFFYHLKDYLYTPESFA